METLWFDQTNEAVLRDSLTLAAVTTGAATGSNGFGSSSVRAVTI